MQNGDEGVVVYCKKCGNQLTEEDIFCPNCGTKKVSLEQINKLDKAPGFFEKAKIFCARNKWLVCIVASVSAAVLIIAIGIFSMVAYQIHRRNALRTRNSNYASDEGRTSRSNGIDFSSLHKYENSTYKIGSTMPAGEYVLFTNSSISGYFCLSSDSSGMTSSIITNDNFNYTSIITVEDGEYLELSRCYAEPIGTAGTLTTSGEGMFKIGTHLSSGEYELQATESISGYYCIYSDSRRSKIVSNDNFMGTKYVTVRDGQYLELSRCKIVK